jgi:hypothetical protein
LFQRLRLKNRLISNRRGFSSIVGAVFSVLVIISLLSTVFVWSLAQNTKYSNAVRTSNQVDLDRQNEKLLASVNCTRVDGNNVLVQGVLENYGPSSGNITTLWVTDSNRSTYAFKSINNLALRPGSTVTTSIIVPLVNVPQDILKCWFVSQRGNIISQNSLSFAIAGGSGNITNVYQTINEVGGDSATYANVSQGIGLIGFDFKGFSHQDFPSKPSSAALNALVKTYYISQNNYVVFHVTLTNYDPEQKTMHLNGTSGIYVIGMHSQTMMYAWWMAVNVTGNLGSGYTVNPNNANIEYVLNYGVPTDVFFAGIQSGGKDVNPGIYPLNIMVFGKLGPDDYGQNVPFVSLNLKN